jgi:hypothetical protein
VNGQVHAPVAIPLAHMTLQQLRDAHRRARVDKRVADFDRIDREISLRHSINDYR